MYKKYSSVKFKGNFKNFWSIARKSFEKILEKGGNFNKILQIGILYKVYTKIV